MTTKTELSDTYLKIRREEARRNWESNGFPAVNEEFWRKSKILSFFKGKQAYEDTPEPKKKGTELSNGLWQGIWHETAEGILYGSYAEAVKRVPELVEKYEKTMPAPRRRNLLDWNLSAFRDGFFFYVPENTVMSEKLHIVSQYKNLTDSTVHTHNLIILAKGAQARIVWEDTGDAESRFAATDSTFIHTGEASRLQYIRLQDINENSALLAMTAHRTEGEAVTEAYIFPLRGGALRNEVHSLLDGPGCRSEWRGFYWPDHKQHTDLRILTEHNTIRSVSHQFFRGIVNHEAEALFNGYILVNRDAQETDAYQQNKHLLLDTRARATAQPFLEIYADNVSCSHGATTGQLDESALFYMCQRGLDKTTARKMLLEAFLTEIIPDLNDEKVTARLKAYIDSKM